MDAKAFSLTKQGASHIKSGGECQDCSDSVTSTDFGYAVAVVCDGHGGDDYVRSGEGSRRAVYTARRMIEDFIRNVETDDFFAGKFFKNPDECIRNLEASIISDWTDRVQNDSKKNPFHDDNGELANVSEKARRKYLGGNIESAYGTTLIAAALTKDYWFGIQIGDGNCVAVNRESGFSCPIEPDEKCFLNVTTSLCDSDAIFHFHHCCQFARDGELPAAVFIGSDGIDDSFGSDEKLFHFYTSIMYSFGTKDFDAAKEELKDYLPRLSEKGSGDDVSLAAVMDMDAVKELKAVKEYDIEREKARKAEEERKAAERCEEERRRADEEDQKRREEEQHEVEKQLAQKQEQLAQERQKTEELRNQLVRERRDKIEKDRQIKEIQSENEALRKEIERKNKKLAQLWNPPWHWSDAPADIKCAEGLPAGETVPAEST